MKSHALSFAAAISLLSASPTWAENSVVAPSDSTDIAQLKWLDKANASALLHADIKKGVFHFYVVCGMTCEPEPFDKVDALECYPSATYFRMEGTADTSSSEEGEKYQEKAKLFALQYNSQLAEFLSRNGRSSCIAGEDWSAAGAAMNRRLSSDPDNEENVGFSYDKATHRFRFMVYMTPEQRNDEQYQDLCAAAAYRHLSGNVTIGIFDKKTQSPLSSIECRYGKVFPSDWKPNMGDVDILPGFDYHY